MIRTSSHKNWNTDLYLTYAISGNRGVDANYEGKCYKALAPKKSFWKIWHNNIGTITEEENNKFYIEEYYKQVLSKLDVKKVFDDLEFGILLCYEDANEFCHRHIVSAWFELMLNVKVPEVIIQNGRLMEVKKPEYIKEYLEEIIKSNINMKGFSSLNALYLFEQSEQYESKARLLEQQGKDAFEERQIACYLRCEADDAEKLYKTKKRVLK